MTYNMWNNGNDCINIADMDTDYINNCIKSINSHIWSSTLKHGKYDEDVKDDFLPLSPEWCDHYGNGYLKRFNEELENRKCKIN